MIEFLSNPWPWYVAGPIIAAVMLTLIWFGKSFGVSSNLRTMCAIGGAGNAASFFDFNWKNQIWNLVFVAGTIIGGLIAATLLSPNEAMQLNPNTVAALNELNFSAPGIAYLPNEIFSWETVLSFKGMSILILGGFLVGFGTRWAGGCTSGHAISGLSNLQVPSLIAVIGFFIGGLLMTHFGLGLLY